MNGKEDSVMDLVPEIPDEVYEKLPPHLRRGVKRYYEHGILPGEFLRRVICNDLTAVMRADPESLASIVDIVRWFYNELPSPCWGSRKKMDAWVKRCAKRDDQRKGETGDARK